MKNLYLCGFMGAGKTTVARALAQRNGVPPLYGRLHHSCGLSIPAIFALTREADFRERETAACANAPNPAP